MKTFLDSGVLLTAWRGTQADSELALAIMEDPKRTFYTSELVTLELLPKPLFFKQHAEVEFYETHFDLAKGIEPLGKELGKLARKLAAQYGIAAMDALHVAAALRQGAQEFVTTEKTGKPMFRIREIAVKWFHEL